MTAPYYYNGQMILAPVTFLSNEPVWANDSLSLKHTRASQGAQRWELSFSVKNNANIYDSFLATMTEITEVGTMIMPQFPDIDAGNTAVGSAYITSAAAAGDDSINVDFSGSPSGRLLRGTFIQFSNHDKVYLLKNGMFFGQGADTVGIYPALVANVPALTTVNYGDLCQLTYYRLVEDMKGISFSDGIMMDQGKINLIEAI